MRGGKKNYDIHLGGEPGGDPGGGHVNGSVSGVGGAGRVGGRSTRIGAIVNAMDDERLQRLIDEADLRDLIHRYAFGL